MFIRKFLFLAVVFLFIPLVVSAETTTTTSTAENSVFKVFNADCENISEGLLANSCYAKRATNNLDCSYCEKINWFGGRVSCCVAVIKSFAREGICDNLTETKLKEKCLLHLAVKTKNGALCKQIKDKNENFACRAEIAKQATDLKQCDKMNKTEKDYCLLKFAETQKNEKICAKIGERGVKRFCYNKLAVLKNNEKLCPLTASADKCYLAVAENKKDGKLCAKIKDGSLTGYCLDRVAVAQKDYKACDLIKGNYKFDCIFDVGKAKNSAMSCEKITDKEKNYQCVVHFATKREDASYCDYLKDQTKIGLCADEVEKTINARVQDTQRISDLKAMQTALELYFMDNSEYPEGKDIILGSSNAVCLINTGIDGENWTCPENATVVYFNNIPADPINTGIYTYTYTKIPGNYPCYHIIARLETNYGEYKAGPFYVTCEGGLFQ